MGERGIGEGGMTYIRSKVGELISGKSSERNITSEAILWGVENEPKSIAYYQQTNDVPVIVTNKHLIHGERRASTPDALIILRDLGNSYDCETLETKSYMTYATHIEHCECNTAAQIKAINKQLYWQVIDQMDIAEVLVGKATFFHPDFPETSKLRQHTVAFRKIELISDFKLLKERNEEAETIFNTKYNNLKNK